MSTTFVFKHDILTWNTSNTTNSLTTSVSIPFVSLGLVALWIFTTNGIVLVAFVRSPSLRQNLANITIASLAMADFLLSIFVVPFAVYFKVQGAWHLGFELQLAWFCLDVLFSAASIMNLCAISVYRYLSIAYPYRIRYGMSRRHVAVLLTVAWGIAFLVSMAVLIESLIGHARAHSSSSTLTFKEIVNRTSYNFIATNCSSNNSNSAHQNSVGTMFQSDDSTTDQRYLLGGRPFLIYGSLLTFFLPLGVMTITGMRSIQLLKRQGVLSSNLHRSSKPEHFVAMQSAPMGVKRHNQVLFEESLYAINMDKMIEDMDAKEENEEKYGFKNAQHNLLIQEYEQIAEQPLELHNQPALQCIEDFLMDACCEESLSHDNVHDHQSLHQLNTEDIISYLMQKSPSASFLISNISTTQDITTSCYKNNATCRLDEESSAQDAEHELMVDCDFNHEVKMQQICENQLSHNRSNCSLASTRSENNAQANLVSQHVNGHSRDCVSKSNFNQRRPSMFALSSKEHRAIRTLLVVFVVFAFLWIPFFVVQLVKAFAPEGTVSDSYFLDLAWLGYVSSGINPILYTKFNPEYKLCIMRLFHQMCNCGSSSSITMKRNK